MKAMPASRPLLLSVATGTIALCIDTQRHSAHVKHRERRGAERTLRVHVCGAVFSCSCCIECNMGTQVNCSNNGAAIGPLRRKTEKLEKHFSPCQQAGPRELCRAVSVETCYKLVVAMRAEVSPPNPLNYQSLSKLASYYGCSCLPRGGQPHVTRHTAHSLPILLLKLCTSKYVQYIAGLLSGICFGLYALLEQVVLCAGWLLLSHERNS